MRTYYILMNVLRFCATLFRSRPLLLVPYAYPLVDMTTGSFSGMHFSIDNHTMTIIEADGVSVAPRQVDDLFVGAAQVSVVNFLVVLLHGSGCLRSRN